MAIVAKRNILLVEDERDVRELMLLHLQRAGYVVFPFENGEDAQKFLKERPDLDLVVLDWMLPGVSGLEICKKLRDQSSVPILMVTARADSTDVILGLEQGADDYIVKPFEIPVFLARVNALIRRSEHSIKGDKTDLLEMGPIKIDTGAHEVRVSDQVVDLTPSEFKLLVALLQYQGKALTRERLIELVQGQGVAVVDRAIDTHMFGLRKKLGDSAVFIETIRGVGYRVKGVV
ncbi:MAG: response regulator transcription factor [Bacteriovoracia bacterium]